MARLTQVAPWLNVEDVDVSLRFYVETLGFRVVKSHGEYGETFRAMVQRDGITLILNRTDQSDRGVRLARHTYADALLYVFCSNAQAEWADLKDRGLDLDAPERSEDGTMDEFTVRDPDGYVLVFASDAPAGA